MAYLTCSNVSVGYGGVPVAEGISFSVSSGDALCIVGENGAGKSTLVKALLGLISPLSGDIAFGEGVHSGEVGYLPQQSGSQGDFPASAWEVALSGRAQRLGLRPFYSKADRQEALTALERVGAASLMGRPFGSLSGGQRQRVLLARALAAGPKLLVLDEPVTGLDPEAAEALYRTVDALRGDGVGVVSVTHDMAGALSHATHILAMGAGNAAFMPASEWAADERGRSWAR